MFSRLIKFAALLLLATPFAFAQGGGQFGNSGSGAGTINNCSAAGNAFYSGAGTVVGCDTNVVDSGSGGLTFSAGVTHITSTEGSIVASAPFFSHTVTWNNGSIAFTDLSTNVTCSGAAGSTTPASASSLYSFGTGGSAVTGLFFGGTGCTNPYLLVPGGAAGVPSIFFNGDTAGQGLALKAASQIGYTNTTKFRWWLGANTSEFVNGYSLSWSNSATDATTTVTTCLDNSATKTLRIDSNAACNDGLGILQYGTIASTGNCASSGGTCSASPSGAVSIAAAATTVTVATTAVTANSEILVTEDSSLGTRLSVTCNTTTGRTYTVTTRTAGTSFVITASAAPATNPACLNYWIIN